MPLDSLGWGLPRSLPRIETRARRVSTTAFRRRLNTDQIPSEPCYFTSQNGDRSLGQNECSLLIAHDCRRHGGAVGIGVAVRAFVLPYILLAAERGHGYRSRK